MKLLQLSSLLALAVFDLFDSGLLAVDASPLRVLSPRKRHEVIVSAHRRTFPVALQLGTDALGKRQECEYGSWRCQGQDLQRCLGGQFGTMRTCAADQVCTTEGGDTGCIWAWQKTAEVAGLNATAISTLMISTSSGPTSSGPAVTSSSNFKAVSSSTSASASSSISVAVPSSTVDASTPGFTISTSSSSATYPSSSTVVISPSSDVMAALANDTTIASSSSADPTIPSRTTASSTTDVEWNAPLSTAPTPTSSSSVVASDSTSTWSEPTHTQSHNLSTLVPEPTSTPLPNLGNSHYVIYSDAWLTEMPHRSAVKGFNKFILAFWLSDKGAVDNAAFWERLSQAEQAEVIKGYKEAGITLMVSAFGATDKPITAGKDPIALAKSLADWVKKNNMAGVDIDLEDNEAMNNHIFIPWIVAFQKELRSHLPAPYLISHAPQAPWFTSASKWKGGYLQVHRECGDGIDFYNIQYYNQGDDQYHTCENLLFDSGRQYPDTSVFQTHHVGGIPLHKLVIGKPLTRGGAANGYMEPEKLKQCVGLAREKGWDAGVMYWEWDHTAQGALRAVVG